MFKQKSRPGRGRLAWHGGMVVSTKDEKCRAPEILSFPKDAASLIALAGLAGAPLGVVHRALRLLAEAQS